MVFISADRRERVCERRHLFFSFSCACVTSSAFRLSVRASARFLKFSRQGRKKRACRGGAFGVARGQASVGGGVASSRCRAAMRLVYCARSFSICVVTGFAERSVKLSMSPSIPVRSDSIDCVCRAVLRERFFQRIDILSNFDPLGFQAFGFLTCGLFFFREGVDVTRALREGRRGEGVASIWRGRYACGISCTNPVYCALTMRLTMSPNPCDKAFWPEIESAR